MAGLDNPFAKFAQRRAMPGDANPFAEVQAARSLSQHALAGGTRRVLLILLSARHQIGSRVPVWRPRACPRSRHCGGLIQSEGLRDRSKALDKSVQKREQDYEKTKPPGFDFARLFGNILSPANYPVMAIPGGGAGMAARVGTGMVQGALAGMLEPSAGGSFGKEKLLQGAGGAVGGAALGAAGKALEPLAGKAEDMLSKLWEQVSLLDRKPITGVLGDRSGSLNIPIGGGRAEGGIPGEAKPGIPAAPGGGELSRIPTTSALPAEQRHHLLCEHGCRRGLASAEGSPHVRQDPRPDSGGHSNRLI